MSMRPSPIEPVPEETARIARAAFRKGNLLMRIRDEIGVLYDDQMFASLYDARGQLAIAPWRLALVTVFQFLENLSDRQAAEAVRGRHRQVVGREPRIGRACRRTGQVGAMQLA